MSSTLPKIPNFSFSSLDASPHQPTILDPEVGWFGSPVREAFVRKLFSSLDAAYRKHGAEKWGRHELLGVMYEEWDEFTDEIRSNSPTESLLKEAFDLIGPILRYLETGDRYNPVEFEEGMRKFLGL